MTMPSSGTIGLQDAAIEFFGASSSGTGGLNETAGNSGFLKSSGTTTQGVSPRNLLNASVPSSAPISIQSLYGASGANMLSIVRTVGSGSLSASWSGSTATVTGTATNDAYAATCSIPSGLFILSVTPVAFTKISGAGTATVGMWFNTAQDNQWITGITLTSVSGTTLYDHVFDITDTGSRVRRMSYTFSFGP